jgi:hypothetical protein
MQSYPNGPNYAFLRYPGISFNGLKSIKGYRQFFQKMGKHWDGETSLRENKIEFECKINALALADSSRSCTSYCASAKQKVRSLPALRINKI